MIGSLANFAVWVLLAVSLVIIGWDEPIRYKFMSRRQVIEAESIYRPTPRKAPDFRAWAPSGTLLDQQPAQQRSNLPRR